METPKRRARLVHRGRPPGPDDERLRREQLRQLARAAAKLGSVYELECWASSLLGQLWERRESAPPLDGVEGELVLGAPMAEGLRAQGGRGAKLALHAIGRLAPGGLGLLCAELAGSLSTPLPAWAGEVGRSRAITAAGVEHPGDGQVVLLEVRGAGIGDHAIGLFIDERLGGIAKQIGLLYGEAERGDDPFMQQLEPIDLFDACERICDAIELTDMWPEAPVGERFSQLRALALARACSPVPGRAVVPWLN